MLLLTNIFLSMLISFILSIIIGLILIPYLKNNANQRLSIYLEEAHKSKKNTPTMGGLIFILSTTITLIIMYALKKITINYHFLIIVITFLGYALIGFIDDYLIIKRNNNKGLTKEQKFLMQTILAVIFFYLFLKSDNEPLLWFHTLNLKYNIGWVYGIFILFILTASSNAVNITDGLDGLAGGLSVISFLTIGLITYNSGWLNGYEEITLFCFTLIGGLLGFLIFNSNPAKIFMGDTGSLTLGATLGSIAILTRREFLLIIIGIVFVLETITVIMQVTYFKLTKGKRLFPITPIHHTLERKHNEKEVVKILWIIGLIGSLIALVIGVK